MTESLLELSVGQSTSAGRKAVNQDFLAYRVPDNSQLQTKGAVFAIADGISTSNVSQVASETAVTAFIADYYSTSDAWSVKKSASRVLGAVNAWLYAQTRNSPYRYDFNMGYVCTFSALILKAQKAYAFHGGDTRIYHLSSNGIEQLTQDHTGLGAESDSYLTRALGMGPAIETQYCAVELAKGEAFILASDGAYDFLNLNDWLDEVLNPNVSLQDLAELMVDQAMQAGSEDNISVQLLRVDAVPSSSSLPENQQRDLLLRLPIPLSPGLIVDGLKIVRQIAMTSRSYVYLARALETGEQVVLKVPSGEMAEDKDYLDNLLLEEWIAKRISNPHVLRAAELTQARQYLHSASEYFEGQTLEQWLKDNPSPSLNTVRSIVAQIATGLQAMHRQEILHQDLRPANIMIDDNATVKIIDFGAARVAGIAEAKARDFAILGTAQFTAPEYFLGEEGSARSDVFSLGVIVYHMLSGQLPYGNAVARSNSVRSQARLKYRPLRDIDKSIPAWVDYAIVCATRIQPHKRYAEVSEFIHDLSHPAEEFQDKSKPPLVERDPVVFWQATSLLLLFGLVVSLWTS